MPLGHVDPLRKALTGTSWHGYFRTVVFKPDDPDLIDKYLTLQTFPSEYMINHIPKTLATKYIANAVPPLAIANWLLRRRLTDHLPHRIETMIDLFAGIGGWALALCYYLRFRINRIIAVDIDKRALELYKLNIEKLCGVPVRVVRIDVMQLRPSTLGSADVVTMSPPCESVSVANVYNNTCEPAVSLTRRALEITSVVKPRLALFEEAPTKRYCMNELVRLLARDGFTAEFVNLAKYGSLNARKRLLAYKR